MYVTTKDGKIVSIRDDKDHAVDLFFETVDASLDEIKYSPAVLTALANGDIPFETWDREQKFGMLEDIVMRSIPFRTIANKSVVAELELIERDRPDPTPSDIHPTESDRHRDKLDQWLSEHVAVENFDADLWSTFYETLTDELRNEVCDVWNDVKDEIGNPANATMKELEEQRNQLDNEL